jgi:hypothetical protein
MMFLIYQKRLPTEPLEVMGGADAVMAAVIGAWLGWEKASNCCNCGLYGGGPDGGSLSL